MLQEVLAKGMKDVALGIYWDPIMVRMCTEAGVGSTMDVRIGGKLGKTSGDPVDLRVTVRGAKSDMAQELGGSKMPMGNAVWLEADGVHLVVNDLRSQTFHPSAFTDLGIDLQTMKAVIVKSSRLLEVGSLPFRPFTQNAQNPRIFRQIQFLTLVSRCGQQGRNTSSTGFRRWPPGHHHSASARFGLSLGQ